MANSEKHVREEGRGSSFFDYWPLIGLVVVTGLASLGIAIGFDSLETRSIMHAYMGIFLTIFALLKIFDLAGFKDGFAMYDLLAQRIDHYGYIYPFIELGLGLAYLSFFKPASTYIATIVLFGFGAAGILNALRQGLDMDCPCMGNVLTVPLSTVTLAEDVAMIVMATVLLYTT